MSAETDWLLAMQREMAPCRCLASHAGSGSCSEVAETTVLVGSLVVWMCVPCAEAAG